MSSEDYVIEPKRNTPIFRHVDVCVVGGSQSGVAAAVCAARNGAKTLLVERDPYLGGQSVGTMVTQWEKRAYINNLGAVCTRGIAKEFLTSILAKGGSDQLWFDPPGCEEMRDGEEWLDIEAIKLTLIEFCESAGVELLLSTLMVDSIVDKKAKRPKVTGVIIENKSGRQAILARAVVDASADLDVVWRAIGEKGCIVNPVEERIDADSYTYYGGIDNLAFIEYCIKSDSIIRSYPRRSNPEKIRSHLKTGRLLYFWGFTDIFEQAEKEGLMEPYYKILKEEMASKYGEATKKKFEELKHQLKGMYVKWAGHDLWVGGGGVGATPFDGTNGEDISKHEVLRMKLDYALLPALRKIPGWESAYIARRSQRIGLRETRVLRAITMLSKEDVFNPDHNRPDAIGRSGGHDPGKNRLFKAYPIPYGCLVPEKLDGVIVAARAIGCNDRVALDAHRGITPTIVVGQAAGTAAALAVKRGVEIRDMDVQELRKILRDAGAVLDVEHVELDTIPHHMGRSGEIGHWNDKPFTHEP